MAGMGCSLVITREFKKVRIEGYTSTFYPAFINLVDNSLHWLSTHDGEKEVQLDARGSTLVVRDSGPGVDKRVEEQIFDFGFSTRPGGSGLGLTIARQVLERAGWTLSYSSAGEIPEFMLAPKE